MRFCHRALKKTAILCYPHGFDVALGWRPHALSKGKRQPPNLPSPMTWGVKAGVEWKLPRAGRSVVKKLDQKELAELLFTSHGHGGAQAASRRHSPPSTQREERSLAREWEWHAVAFQKDPPEASGWRFLCESEAAGGGRAAFSTAQRP